MSEEMFNVFQSKITGLIPRRKFTVMVATGQEMVMGLCLSRACYTYG